MRMNGPTEMLRRGISTPEKYETVARARAAHSGQRVIEMNRPIDPYLNCGRWVADCVCGAGIAVNVDWPFCACFACFRFYRTVRKHVEFDLVEAALIDVADDRAQSWTPGMSVDEVVQRTANLPRKRDGLPAVADARTRGEGQ